MQLTSSAFQTGGAIPARYTSDGGDISPDSPGRKPQIERSHLFLSCTTRTLPEPVDLRIWVVYNIPPSLGSAAENVPKQELVASLGLQGKNDGGKVGYVGPLSPLRVSTVTSLGCLPWIKNSTCRLEPVINR